MASAKEAGRSRLDASLVSPALSQRAHLLEIVREKLSSSPVLDKNSHAWRTKESIDKAAEKRASEIFAFLEALRSARQQVIDNDDKKSPFSWKIKEETELMRVMYRPGPEGTPFHTYCVEGIINGPMVDAVCVSWEAPSYSTWWPQFNVPTFKVVESKWVKRIRVGEDLSHIRVKVPWPLAAREVLMTEFELEYFEDDIVIVVLGTAPSDPDEVEEEIYGFSAEELPPVMQDVVRMDVAGGFMLQKITENQSFFRTIVNMDIKLEFVPPWIINFITRQLVGSGYKLYQKAVLSASKAIGSGRVFQQLLATEPLYKLIKSRTRRAAANEATTTTPPNKIEQQNENTSVAEIVPEVVNTSPSGSSSPADRFRASLQERHEPVIKIDAEVERALEVLDRMIELVRDLKSSQEFVFTENRGSSSSSTPVELENCNGGEAASKGSQLTSSQACHRRRLGCFGSGRSRGAPRESRVRSFFSRQ